MISLINYIIQHMNKDTAPMLKNTVANYEHSEYL